MRISILLVAGTVVAAGRHEAQSLYSFDPTLAVTEFTGPPAGACAYPNGPVISAFPAAAAICPGPAPFAGIVGDVAVDVTTDIVYVTDGAIVSGYTSAGVQVGSIPPPLAAITGLAVDSGPGLLWLTDGVTYGAIPLGAGCAAGVPFAVGPFPVPIGPIFGGPITDLDWDSATGTLLACDVTGLVGSFVPGPAPAPGPYGVFPVLAGPCGLVPPLVGIAIDKALPGSGTHYVTDGLTVARLLPGGGLAPPTFYSPAPCFPAPPAPPIAGLAFAGRQITYGAGADNAGLPVPTIGSVGESWVGNPLYTVTLAGSVPGGVARLKYSFGSLCPPLGIVGVPIYLSAPRFTAVIVGVGAGGGAAFAAPIPPAIPFGLSIYLQWVVLTGVSVQVTSGAELTTIMP
jgi:hypothetical protein